MDIHSLNQFPVYPEFLRDRLAEDARKTSIAIEHFSTIEKNY